MTNKKTIVLPIIGVYFLLLGITAILRSFYNNAPYQILYACYIGAILIGIGILTKKSFIILSQVYILAIPLLVWDIDFIHWLIFNKPLWGITDYFFNNPYATIDKFISLQHLYTIPLSLYTIKLIGIKRKNALNWSFIQVVVFFLIITIFSPPSLNVNCVFSSCIDVNSGLPYVIVWFLASFSMIIITALLFSYFLRKQIHNK